MVSTSATTLLLLLHGSSVVIAIQLYFPVDFVSLGTLGGFCFVFFQHHKNERKENEKYGERERNRMIDKKKVKSVHDGGER